MSKDIQPTNPNAATSATGSDQTADERKTANARIFRKAAQARVFRKAASVRFGRKSNSFRGI